MYEKLFTDFSSRGMRTPNRFVMAPMTRGAAPGGVPTTEMVDYYRARAAGGIGLIITEGVVIDRDQSASSLCVPVLDESSADAWRAVIDAVHCEGAKIVPQLWHVGIDPLMWDQADDIVYPSGAAPVSPSGIDPIRQRGYPMSTGEIHDVIEGFARAARLAVSIGFDGIELHGAHGYLIDQFLWAETNHRRDGWGGEQIADRARFGAEVVTACREQIGPRAPIIFRFSQWKVGYYQAKLASDPTELASLLMPLADAGVDVFHCSTRIFTTPEFAGSDKNLAAWTREVTGKPVITVGSVGLDNSDFLGYLEGEDAGLGDFDAAVTGLEAGHFDLVAIGRGLIANPDLPRKLREGRLHELRPFAASQLATLD